jgi:phosphopantetheinyl transferase
LEELHRLSQAFQEPIWQEMKDLNQLRERMASRLAMKALAESMGLAFTGIDKNMHGAPLLRGHRHPISISHTKGLAAGIIGENAHVGIDVEYKSERIMRIAPRFMNTEELERFGNNWLHTLACWCAKEAVYKLAMQPGLIFQSQILIEGTPFSSDFGAILLAAPQAAPKRISLYLRDLGGHLLVAATC